MKHSIAQANEHYPERQTPASMTGKSPQCCIQQHDRCRNEHCACPCHDEKRPA